MAQHFLDLPDAATLDTRQFQLTARIVTDLVKHNAMGVVHGPAGTGKTYAVEDALEQTAAATTVVYSAMAFQSKPTMLQVQQEIALAVTGSKPPRSYNRYDLARMLTELLAGPQRLLVIDEAQRLNGDCLETIRHLHDHRDTRFALLYVGGDSCWEVLSKEPMFRSRVFRRLPFQPIKPPSVPGLIRRFHPIYAQATDQVLTDIDTRFAHGNLRDWAVFTHTAAALCDEHHRPHIDPDVIANTYALLGGGISD
ncbi:ATP-binding protein [Spirillospora sp. NPDC052269]